MADRDAKFNIDQQNAQRDIVNIGQAVFIGDPQAGAGQGARIASSTNAAQSQALQSILTSLLSEMGGGQLQTIKPKSQFADLLEIFQNPADFAQAIYPSQPGTTIPPAEVPRVGNREDDLETALNKSGGRLCIIGRTGEGKTREITELLSSLLHGNDWLICVAQRDGFRYNLELPDFPNELSQKKIIILLDDFHGFLIDSQYREDGDESDKQAAFVRYLEQLIEMIESYRLPRDIFVVVTVPSEPHYQKYLESASVKALFQHFSEFELPPLSRGALTDLLKRLSAANGVELAESDVNKMIDVSDGTPSTVVQNVERAIKMGHPLRMDENWLPVQGQNWKQLFHTACKESGTDNVVALYHAVYLCDSLALPSRPEYILALGRQLSGQDLQGSLDNLENLGLLTTFDDQLFSFGVQELISELQDLGGPLPGVEAHWRMVTDAISAVVEQKVGWADDLIILSRKLYAAKRFRMVIELADRLVNIIPKNPDVYFQRGGAYHSLGEFEQAIPDYGRVIELYPGSEMAHYYRGIANQITKQLNLAMADYQAAINIAPNYADAQFQIAFLQHNQSQFDLAEAGYTRVIELRPKHRYAYCNRGMVRVLRGKFAEGKTDLDQALSIDPTIGQIYAGLGAFHLYQGRFDEAIENFDKFGQLDPENRESLILQGVACAMRGEDEAAKGHLQRFLDLFPDDFRANYMLGVLQYLQGEHQAALKQVKQVIDSGEMNQFVGFAHFFLATVALEVGEIEEAYRSYHIASTYVPQNAVFYLIGGILSSFREEFDDAKDQLSKALQINPEFIEAHLFLGLVFSDLGDHSAAVDKFNNAKQFGEESLELFYNRGFSYMQLGETEKALSDFDEALKISPNDVDALFYRGSASSSLGNNEVAIESYSSVLKLSPESVDIYLYRGNCYYASGDYEAAIKDYQSLNEAQPPGNKFAFHNLGLAYANLDNYESSLQSYTHALEIDPRYISALKNRGDLYFGREEFDEAIADYTSAIQLERENGDLFILRADAYIAQKNYSAAVKDYQEYLKIIPENIEVWIKLGNAQLDSGELESALDAFTEVQRLDRSNIYGWFNRAIVYTNMEDYPSAIADFTQAVELSPEEVVIYLERARAYYFMEEYEKALVDCEEVLTRNSEHPEGHNFRALIHIALGDKEAAYDAIKKAYELQPDNASILYNLACLEALIGDELLSLTYLEKSIALDPSLRDSAKEDEDFVNLRTNSQFRKIVG